MVIEIFYESTGEKRTIKTARPWNDDLIADLLSLLPADAGVRVEKGWYVQTHLSRNCLEAMSKPTEELR